MVRNRKIRTRRKRVPCLGPDCTRMMISRDTAHRFCRWCKVRMRTERSDELYSMDGREATLPWQPLYCGVPGKVYRDV